MASNSQVGAACTDGAYAHQGVRGPRVLTHPSMELHAQEVMVRYLSDSLRMVEEAMRGGPGRSTSMGKVGGKSGSCCMRAAPLAEVCLNLANPELC